ncbi:rubredoxin [Desulfohalovibrio reitneri]|uniref:rubredoxin n=1 Tax=Desulfohalovibrio reitneri TaxID=1307759 RepID=UPI0009E03DAF
MGKANEMYQCQVHNCGYVYDPEVGDPPRGIKPGTQFQDLPEDWKCPICGAHKHMFKPLAGPGSVLYENVRHHAGMAGYSDQEIEKHIAKGDVRITSRVAASARGAAPADVDIHKSVDHQDKEPQA